MGTLSSGTGDFNSRLNLPIYTTGNYPNGVEGDMIYDTTAGSIFIFNGTNWVPPGFGRKPIATGGDATLNIGGETHHFFYSAGILNVTAGGDAYCYVIGGGGGGSGGGPNSGGAGGAGGGLVFAKFAMTTGSISVTVGTGGLGGVSYQSGCTAGQQGGQSQFSHGGYTFTATGGNGALALTSNYNDPGQPGGTGNINGNTAYSYDGVNAVFGTGGQGGDGTTNTSNAPAVPAATNGAPGGGGGSTNNGTPANGGNGSASFFTGGGGGGARDGDGGNGTIGQGGTGYYSGGRGSNPSQFQGENGGSPNSNATGGNRGTLGSRRWNAGGGGGFAGGGGGAAGDCNNSPNASGGQGGNGLVVIKYQA